jgi:ferritin-like metal-binding protein YciE
MMLPHNAAEVPRMLANDLPVRRCPAGVAVLAMSAAGRFELNQETRMETLQDLFLDTLKDIYYAEKAILKALPKMAKRATSEDLATAFETHRDETEQQVTRLEEIFGILDKPARGKKCPAIDGILKEGQEIIKEAEDDTVRDAGMLAAAQAVEHYEISRYGTLKAWAEKLGLDDVALLLDETLEEEKATDIKLTDLAESEINIEANEEPAEPRTKSKAKRRV